MYNPPYIPCVVITWYGMLGLVQCLERSTQLGILITRVRIPLRPTLKNKIQ